MKVRNYRICQRVRMSWISALVENCLFVCKIFRRERRFELQFVRETTLGCASLLRFFITLLFIYRESTVLAFPPLGFLTFLRRCHHRLNNSTQLDSEAVVFKARISRLFPSFYSSPLRKLQRLFRNFRILAVGAPVLISVFA